MMALEFDRPLLLTWFALVALGTLMVASASVGIGSNFLVKHAVFISLSALVFCTVLAIPSVVWERTYLLLWLVGVIVCVLVLVPGIGTEENGARRWIDLGAFSLQASELAKPTMLLYLAGYLARFHEQMQDPSSAGLKLLAVPATLLSLVAILLLMEPDFGTVVVWVSPVVVCCLLPVFVYATFC